MVHTDFFFLKEGLQRLRVCTGTRKPVGYNKKVAWPGSIKSNTVLSRDLEQGSLWVADTLQSAR